MELMTLTWRSLSRRHHHSQRWAVMCANCPSDPYRVGCISLCEVSCGHVRQAAPHKALQHPLRTMRWHSNPRIATIAFQDAWSPDATSVSSRSSW